MESSPATASHEPAPTPGARFGARALLAGVALLLLAVPFGLMLFLVQGEWAPLLRLDEGARDDLHRHATDHDGFVSAMRALSTVGSAWVYAPAVAIAAAALARRRRPRLAAFVVVTVVGSSILNRLVKLAVDRARPVLPDPVAHASGLSFPSGHAQAAVVCYTLLLLLVLPRLRPGGRRLAVAGAALMVLAIGFSRVALGVHYVSDVVAGYALGAAWVAAMVAAFRIYGEERRAERARATRAGRGGRRPPR